MSPSPYSLCFSHTDLVPAVGPCTKELVTTPITGLRSLNTSNNTVRLLIYLHGLAHGRRASQQNSLQDESVSNWSGSTGESGGASEGSERSSTHRVSRYT